MSTFMSVATSSAEYTVQVGNGVLRLLHALFTFNCQVVVTLYRVVVDGCQAVFSIISLLATACWEILAGVFEFLGEIGQFLIVCLSLLLEVGVHLLRFLSLAFSGLELVLLWISEGLLVILQYVYKGLLFMYTASGLSSITPVAIKKTVYAASLSLWDYLTCVKDNFIALNLYVFTQVYTLSCVLANEITHTLSTITNAIWRFLCACFLVISRTISNIWTPARKAVPKYITFEFYITFLITIVAVIMSMLIVRSLNKRGLTFPMFVQSSNQVLDLGEADDFLESDVDDGEQEEEDVEETDGSVDGEEEDDDDVDDEDDEEDVEEYSIADSDSEDGENDQNVINIQLPVPGMRYALRDRASPGPCYRASMSPRDLEETLESERDKRLCVVCVDQVKTVLVLPCKHMCLCVDCAREIAQLRQRERRVCPLCRRPIETVMDVYV